MWKSRFLLAIFLAALDDDDPQLEDVRSGISLPLLPDFGVVPLTSVGLA
jgi:hypothetical protein